MSYTTLEDLKNPLLLDEEEETGEEEETEKPEEDESDEEFEEE